MSNEVENLQLNIPESQLPVLKSLYEVAYQELIGKIDPLQRQLSEMEPILIQLGIIPAPLRADSVDPDGYDTSWRWLKKIEFLIDQAKRPLTSVDIVNEIKRREPREKKDKLMNSIPATLSVAYKEGKILRTENTKGKGSYAYDTIIKKEADPQNPQP